MNLESLPELLFVSIVSMDPALDGCSGVLVEIHRQREPSGDEWYVLLEIAATTGNQLLRFSSRDKNLVYAALSQELSSLLK